MHLSLADCSVFKIILFFSASGMAGFAGAVASNPIDVVKVGCIVGKSAVLYILC